MVSGLVSNSLRFIRSQHRSTDSTVGSSLIVSNLAEWCQKLSKTTETMRIISYQKCRKSGAFDFESYLHICPKEMLKRKTYSQESGSVNQISAAYIIDILSYARSAQHKRHLCAYNVILLKGLSRYMNDNLTNVAADLKFYLQAVEVWSVRRGRSIQ